MQESNKNILKKSVTKITPKVEQSIQLTAKTPQSLIYNVGSIYFGGQCRIRRNGSCTISPMIGTILLTVFEQGIVIDVPLCFLCFSRGWVNITTSTFHSIRQEISWLKEEQFSIQASYDSQQQMQQGMPEINGRGPQRHFDGRNAVGWSSLKKGLRGRVLRPLHIRLFHFFIGHEVIDVVVRLGGTEASAAGEEPARQHQRSPHGKWVLHYIL